MTFKKLLPLYFILCGVISVAAQQIEIPRINLIRPKPTPFLIRDWKQVTLDYDNYVFDTNKTGTNLPLTNINMAAGIQLQLRATHPHGYLCGDKPIMDGLQKH